jgi:hypothetical protein
VINVRAAAMGRTYRRHRPRRTSHDGGIHNP